MGESDVPSTIKTRNFRPTVKQLENFPDYVKSLEDKDLSFALVCCIVVI